MSGRLAAPDSLQVAGRAAEGHLVRETLLAARSVTETELGAMGRGFGDPALCQALPATATPHDGGEADIARGLHGGNTPLQALCFDPLGIGMQGSLARHRVPRIHPDAGAN